MITSDTFSQFGSLLASLMFFWAMYQHYLPSKIREAIELYASRYTHKLVNYFSPYLAITFAEYTNDRFNRSEVYTTIETYLSDKSSMEARSMKADYIKNGKSLLLSLGDNEEVVDQYCGVQVRWSFITEYSSSNAYPFYPTSDEKRYYRLVFHSRHRKFVLDSYLPYLLEEGESIAIRKRRRKLFTNAGNDGPDWMGDRGTMWSHIEFKHPARFDMLAMEKSKKQMIIEDLQWFQEAKDYYAEIGKPWKRGYLLHGPPGTGKSTLVAAMANLLEYDIYDLELTAVKDNMQLRKLLIETSSKSIILIEDIDCSLDLTGQRNKKKAKGEDNREKDPIKNPIKEAEGEKKGSEVTLSGLLNLIDGIWSACGEERIIVFTTNHIEKLDPALIRRGRMDVHVEMSYCRYESFKVLAKNYLKLESHPLFETIGRLLEETVVTPADVAENLMPRSVKITKETCLENLIKALEKVKEESKLKPKKEATSEQETEEKSHD